MDIVALIMRTEYRIVGSFKNMILFCKLGSLLALVAQSVERIHGKDEVIGSIPFESSIFLLIGGLLLVNPLAS